jgi:Co/Zn/Cd efflux system component
MTFGLKRVEILSAQVNGITLLVLAVWIVYEAIRRLISPPEVEAGLILAIALVGIVVNVVAAWTLSRANRRRRDPRNRLRPRRSDRLARRCRADAALCIRTAEGLRTRFPRGDVTVGTDADCHQARLRLASLLEERFDVHHSTLQVEHRPERLLNLEGLWPEGAGPA